MSRRRIKRRSSSSQENYEYGTFFSNERQPAPVPQGLATWPVVECLVPIEDVWRATACGSVCVVRRQPDTRWAFSCFGISLIHDGLELMFGEDDVTPEEFDSMMDQLRTGIPPMAPGPIEAASDYVWGAWVYNEDKRSTWPLDQSRRHAAMVPKPQGARKDWKRRLVGPGGLTPTDLVQVIRRNDIDADIPEGKEVIVITEMTFQVADTDAVVDMLGRKRPELTESSNSGNSVTFDWTRKHPRPGFLGWGKRQHLGTVRIDHPDRLVATAQTLTFAAKLAGMLESMFGDDIRLLSTDWVDPLQSIR